MGPWKGNQKNFFVGYAAFDTFKGCWNRGETAVKKYILVFLYKIIQWNLVFV